MNKSEQKKYRWEELKKLSDGLLPVVVQDDESNQVLMVAYMNEEAWNKTLETGTMTYYSRSRKELWVKGATSGHYQYAKAQTYAIMKTSMPKGKDFIYEKISIVR